MYPYSGGADQYVGFITIGDPEMNLWTDTPCSLLVNHPLSIPIGQAIFTVNVSTAGNSLPVSDATVCLMGEADSTIYVVDTTDANGDAYFEIHPLIANDTVYVTVTGRNLQPYEGLMTTSESGAYVGYYASIVDDLQGGNGDQNINPGEEINLHLWVRNYGADTAIAVNGILQSTDPYITISDSARVFGDMAPGQICSTGSYGYAFSVALNAPDGHVIEFLLDCRDVSDSSWISSFNETVHAADLNFHEAVVSGGNGNSSLDPGETAGLVVSLDNNGSAAVDSLSATLRCQSGMITIPDSIGYYPLIEPGQTIANSADSFVVTADANIAPGASVDFKMLVATTYYVDTIDFSLTLGTGIEDASDPASIMLGALDLYPNPCNGILHMRVNGPVAASGHNTIRIYDAGGLLVHEYPVAGSSDMITWTGKNLGGRQVSSGVYFIRLYPDDTSKTYKVIFLR
jgi:hypothetical protein